MNEGRGESCGMFMDSSMKMGCFLFERIREASVAPGGGECSERLSRSRENGMSIFGSFRSDLEGADADVRRRDRYASGDR